MKALLKQLYDYQWELTLAGAQLDEKILRSRCSAETEAAVRGLCRNLIITASDIKYELISLEQSLNDDNAVKLSEKEKTDLIRDSFQQMERSLFRIIKNFVNLMAQVEEQPEEEETTQILKENWPKIAEVYQYFKTSLLKVEEENYL